MDGRTDGLGIHGYLWASDFISYADRIPVHQANYQSLMFPAFVENIRYQVDLKVAKKALIKQNWGLCGPRPLHPSNVGPKKVLVGV